MIRARNATDEHAQDCVANAEMLLSIITATAQQTHSLHTTQKVFSMCILEDLSVALNITARVPVIANTRHASRQTRPHSQKERSVLLSKYHHCIVNYKQMIKPSIRCIDYSYYWLADNKPYPENWKFFLFLGTKPRDVVCNQGKTTRSLSSTKNGEERSTKHSGALVCI
jgi:hypothetical protein